MGVGKCRIDRPQWRGRIGDTLRPPLSVPPAVLEAAPTRARAVSLGCPVDRNHPELAALEVTTTGRKRYSMAEEAFHPGGGDH
jgi:hypothetical protein